jgi:hypothetical protein
MTLGQGHHLTASLACGRDRDQLRRESPMGATGDFQVGPADRLGERGSLGEVPLRVGESPRPRLDDPEIQQRDSPQLTSHRDRFARFVSDRRIEQIHLLDDFTELPAAPCERQLQRRNCHHQAAAASRRSALDVGLGQRQLSSRLLQPALVQLCCRVS